MLSTSPEADEPESMLPMRTWRVNSRSCSADVAALATVRDETRPWAEGENPSTQVIARKAIKVEERTLIVVVYSFAFRSTNKGEILIGIDMENKGNQTGFPVLVEL